VGVAVGVVVAAEVAVGVAVGVVVAAAEVVAVGAGVGASRQSGALTLPVAVPLPPANMGRNRQWEVLAGAAGAGRAAEAASRNTTSAASGRSVRE
jgi:hypothetical protein